MPFQKEKLITQRLLPLLCAWICPELLHIQYSHNPADKHPLLQHQSGLALQKKDSAFIEGCHPRPDVSVATPPRHSKN